MKKFDPPVRRVLRAFVLLATLLLLPAAAMAQNTGDTAKSSLPKLDVEDVIVIGRSSVVLPAARKGEVYDTTVMKLTGRDSLLFGDRMSYLGGSGGLLPAYREFQSPLRATLEGSIGSYISPHGRGHVEFIRPSFDVFGTLDYASTQGHIDSAAASSVLAELGGSIVMPGDRVIPRQRLSGDLEWIDGNYTLYGNPVLPVDRSRSGLRVRLGLRSEERTPVEYGIDIGIASTSVEDTYADTTVATVSALSPDLALDVGLNLDSIHLGARVDYAVTSLQYSSSTRSPSNLVVGANLEVRPTDWLRVIGGIGYGRGEFSDSGSVSAVLPNAALWLRAADGLALFARFSSELRTASYRNRLFEAPYAEAQMPMRPEYVPASVAAGLQTINGTVDLEAEGFLELAENTPVVVATAPGELAWTHVDSRSMGLRAHASIRLIPSVELAGDLVARRAVETGSDRALPMTPAIDLDGRLTWSISDALDVFGTVRFESPQEVTYLDGALLAEELSSRFLVGGGARYRLTGPLELFAEVSNLFNQDYDLWHGYSAPGLEIRGGARLVFGDLR